MKTFPPRLLASFVTALGFVALSCSQEPVREELLSVNGETMSMELAASVEGSRVSLDFPSVSWQDSDEIVVLDGAAVNVFSLKPGSNTGSSAVFSGTVSEGSGVLHAVYPAAAARSLSGGRIKAEVPAFQTIPEGEGADPAALVSVCMAEDGRLNFRQATALLRFTISMQGVTEVVLKGSAFCGTALFDADGSLVSSESTTDEVTLRHSGGTFAPGTYYAAVLPGATPAGAFSVSVACSDGRLGSRTSSSALSIQRRFCLDLGTLDDVLEWSHVIMTKEQLFAWNAARDVDDGSEVQLGADIDMGGDTWLPRDFAGTFDGKGHKIYNLNVVSDTYAGFFRELGGSAVVRDLVVGSSDGSSYDGTSVIRHASSANNYTWYYAGVVAKASGSASITGVQNFATVEVASGSTGKTRIGGIVGGWNSEGTLADCTNFGTVRNLASATGKASVSDDTLAPSHVGGILGFVDLRSSFSGLRNSGPVSTSNPGVSTLGGVAGNDPRGSAFNACSNSGSVTHEASTLLADTAVAGIVAWASGTSSAFGNAAACTNEGAVSAAANGKIVRIAGITGYTNYYNLDNCYNGGAISYSNGSATAGYIAIGGVAGHTYHGCMVSDCRNGGPVSSDKPQVNRIGGIVGNLNSSAIRNCTNEASGSVSLDNSATVTTTWQGIGGITGFSEGTTDTREISGCINLAAVSALVNTLGNTSYRRCAAGGIIGMPYTTMTISGNVNRGAVSLENKHSSAPYAFAGGIAGQDSGAASASSLRSNVNYGNVSIASGLEGFSGAGGLFGNIASASAVGGNCNFGSVSGTVAGAVAGVNALDFAATVCNALTVNGMTYAAASLKAAWACPSSTGTISLTVTPHSDTEDGSLSRPLEADNKVVAHRGGATESGYPDNSRAALRYAMRLGCYASECDIYWTKDNEVLVAHADSECKINGLHPWEATAAEIQAVARLKNYERIPTLAEYLDIVMEPGSCTRLLLDIKMITSPSLNYDYPANAALRALEIIEEKGAQNFVEFICTGYENVMKKIAPAMKASGIPCGWMNGSISAASFKSKGYTGWANLNVRDHFSVGAAGSEDKGTGNRTVQEFKNAGLELSIFHLDKQKGNSSAVYTDDNVATFLQDYSYLRCITTNYPAWLITKTKSL